ncbi:unnamed protein product [Rhodiola kirilowii]
MGGDSVWSSDEESIFQNYDSIRRDGEFCSLIPPSDTNLDFEQRRTQHVQKQVLRSYEQLQIRSQGFELEEARNKILSYTPGAWMEKPSDAKLAQYKIPKITTLLLLGPKGSGKSTLLNRVSKVFDSDKFAPDRAQVSYMASNSDGTYFLQEYAIPKNSRSVCLYDTRSLSDCFSDNDVMLKRWLEKGVRDGEVVIRNSDDSGLKGRLLVLTRGRQTGCISCKIRKVNFVIFVVNGVSVLKAMDSEGAATDQHYNKLVATTFRNPYLSFRDDKPVLVFTHGDLLSLVDRVRVRIYLGELLGIPPATQIFDIPETDDAATDLPITDMLRYSLEHADKNIPRNNLTLQSHVKIKAVVLMCVFLLIAIWMAYIQKRLLHDRKFGAPLHHSSKFGAPKPDLHINWHQFRHIW